jgi:alcohol dehydrogenase class IV
MVIPSFNYLGNQMLLFGAGKLKELPNTLKDKGKNILLVWGNHFNESAENKENLINRLQQEGLSYQIVISGGEPSPEYVDQAVSEYKKFGPDAVVAIGGGSVIDAGKAMSAMLTLDESVENYLEGIGNKNYQGKKIPFIAIPTTSGTGSEATKNAVLSKIGKEGYKRSLRHDSLMPDIALVDPELTISCPPSVTAASGLDAFTQLLESYVSTKATPLTDALAFSGMEMIRDALLPACSDGWNEIKIRSSMSYGAYLSGLTLSNAGLGLVHGFASSIGGHFNIPHGVICGTLLGVCTRITIEQLIEEKKHESLDKYAKVGLMIHHLPYQYIDKGSRREGCNLLIRKLNSWIDMLHIPGLGYFGFSRNDIDTIVGETDNKYNPAKIPENEMMEILLKRL